MGLNPWPKPFQYFRDVKVFLITLSIIIAAVLAVIFFFRERSVRKLMLHSLQHESASYGELIMLTRHWNAEYGGVYVEKRPGVVANPYLRDLGIDPDKRTVDGKVLTLRNPAIMTRELSELTRWSKGVRFHLVSLRNINPENQPDPFERTALLQFEQGSTEAWQITRIDGQSVFRYVMPLLVNESCLACHGRQGYKLGEIRGGISVLVPTAEMELELRKNRIEIALVAFGTIGLIVVFLYFMTWKLVKRLDETQKKLKKIAVTDELTGLRNRRYIMGQVEKEHQRSVRSGEPLSLIVLDIDHFKRVNDTYGHAFGDVVLKAVADCMRESLRSYDLLGRIGGEEFLIASPGSTLDDAAGLAQRILDRIRREKIAGNGRTVSVTMSAGVTQFGEQDAEPDVLFTRADAALYLAKQQGRDRVIAL